MENKKGLFQIYTGDGKGKTTASLGLALRALGHNMSVYMIQFMKSGDTGEMFSIQKYLPHFKFVQFGKNALKEKQLKMVSFDSEEKIPNNLTEKEVYVFPSDNEEVDPSELGFEHAKKIIGSGEYDLVILDEINCALSRGIVSIEQAKGLINGKPDHVEIVFTGRDAPKEIKELADLVSEVKRIKHPYDIGILARKGIEY
jgi:cob(I)alamin adenosyltransferase